jgi:YggT family protein
MCAVADLLDALLSGYLLIVLVAVVMSWLSPNPAHPLVRFVYRLTDPAFVRVRRALRTEGMGLDLSPVVVVVGIYLIRLVVVGGLRRAAGC